MAEDTHPAVRPDVPEQAESEVLTDFEQEDLLEAEDLPLPITYSGQDFDVAGLVRRLSNDDILIPTFGHDDERIAAAGFQRSFVWNRPQMDRFIESLLLGYPIPGIFLVRQPDRRYFVLDGHQRLRTLEAFYEGVHDGKAFALKNVGKPLRGLTYKTLTEDQRRLLDDTFIQATIVSTDGSRDSLDAIYQVFERLNAGGTQLTAHEIRVALYAGPFIDFLAQLNDDPSWRRLYGKPSPRLRDQELVLRILGLYLNSASYRRPLKTFLNDVAGQYRDLTELNVELVREHFSSSASLLDEAGGHALLRREGYQVNAALTEASFVGLMRRLDHGSRPDAIGIQRTVEVIRADETMDAAISRATADEENVRTRLEIATAHFARV